MKVLITRHGKTDWNVQRKIQGSVDTVLNEIGIAQAEEVREKLKDTKIDLVFSSPLKRAYMTAEIIMQGRNVPIIKDERIRERCFGILEGKEKNQVKDWKNVAWKLDQDVDVENIEQFRNVWARIKDFFDEITEKYKDQNVLVVFHGGVSILARYYFEKDVDVNNLYVFGLDNCEVKEYDI